MSALEAETIAIREALACIDAGDHRRAAVWLRLADEACAADWAEMTGEAAA